MSYCTPHDVKLITNTKPKQFGLEPNDNSGLDNIIQEWIDQAEDLINSYCHRTFTDEIPLAIKNVCIRLTANIIAFQYARRDNPLIQVNDWTREYVSSEIFTQDLKNDLKPHRKRKHLRCFNI